MMCFAISAVKANRLYWLGRYTERVYISLHLLRKCYDRMIDGSPQEYMNYYHKMDVSNMYKNLDSFKLGLMYDTTNPASLIRSIESANDNAIVLREEITSESLAYIQLSMLVISKYAEVKEPNITNLQSITDHLLAFWGSIDERVADDRVINLIKTGRLVENIDMHVRFSYEFDRIKTTFDQLGECEPIKMGLYDNHIMSLLKSMLNVDEYNPEDTTYETTLLKYMNQLVLV